MQAQSVELREDDDGSVDMSLDEETVAQARDGSALQQPASPTYTPNSPTLYPSTTPAGPALPAYLTNPTPNPYLPQTQTTYQPAQPAPPIATTYPPTTSGIYPSMGSTSNAAPLTREEATTRAVNAQWWAGYWFAMSEVMPSVAQVEQTQEGLQR